MYKSIITDEEVKKLKPLNFSGKIHVINKDSQISSALSVLEKEVYLGFDTETKPNFSKGSRNKVSMLQLSTEEDAFLFRLHHITDYKSVFSILSNDKITKVGVAVSGDFKELNCLNKFTPTNFIDLQSYVKDFEIKNISLKKMCAIVLNGKISKRQQRSNWDVATLSIPQLRYAATDAWVSLMIYKKLLFSNEK